MKSLIDARIWKLQDDIDTDIIIPTQYLALKTVDNMKKYAFSPLRSELAGLINPGDIIVAGKNFGCGSSREQAPEILVALGVGCIIAKSFARIFYRNALNNGLLLIENNELPDICSEGDRITVDFGKNQIIYKNERFNLPSIPEELFKMVEAGGLVPYIRKQNGI